MELRVTVRREQLQEGLHVRAINRHHAWRTGQDSGCADMENMISLVEDIKVSHRQQTSKVCHSQFK